VKENKNLIDGRYKMQYHLWHQASGIRHQACQFYVLNLSNNHKIRVFKPNSFRLPNLTTKVTLFFTSLKPKLTKKTTLILFSQLAISSYAHSALSASTTHVIIGNAPEVVALSSADKQGFTVNGIFYSEASGNIKASEIKEFDGNLTFNDFTISKYDSKNLDKVKNYRDIDGDNADPSVPFKLETTYYWWYDNTGKRIEGDDKKKIIGCGSGYAMPLKLIIKTNVKTYSAYGIPKESEPITLAKTYQIAPVSQICYAKPNSTIVHPEYQWIGTDLATDAYYFNRPEYSRRHPLVGGGYTQDYVPNYGFKAKPTVSLSTFPTTGFPGAKFQLVMSGAQTDYRYQVVSNSGGAVSIDQDGIVKLNNKPSGRVTVRAILKRDTSVIHDYHFSPTSIWVVPQNFSGEFEAVKQQCGGLQNMLSYTQLTNSPRYDGDTAKLGFDKLTLSNSYTRAIGDSIFSEWGWATKSSYPDSEWQEYYAPPNFNSRYWTSDSQVVDGKLISHVVHNHDGFTGMLEDSWKGYAVCKE
jgi:hypothetical protein